MGTQSASSAGVSSRDKNNLVHIAIARGAAPTTGSVAAQLKAEKQAQPTLSFRAPQVVKLHAGMSIKRPISPRTLNKRIRLPGTPS